MKIRFEFQEFRKSIQSKLKKSSDNSATRILGLTCGHDASATIIVDGLIVAHVLAERVTGRRHDFGIRKSIIKQALASAGLS